MVKPFTFCLGLVILGLLPSPTLAQPETFIGFPDSQAPSTNAFARWQQINNQSETNSDSELEGMVIQTQNPEDLVEETEDEGSFEQMFEAMQRLPVRVDYTGVGLIYERSY